MRSYKWTEFDTGNAGCSYETERTGEVDMYVWRGGFKVAMGALSVECDSGSVDEGKRLAEVTAEWAEELSDRLTKAAKELPEGRV